MYKPWANLLLKMHFRWAFPGEGGRGAYYLGGMLRPKNVWCLQVCELIVTT